MCITYRWGSNFRKSVFSPEPRKEGNLKKKKKNPIVMEK